MRRLNIHTLKGGGGANLFLLGFWGNWQERILLFFWFPMCSSRCSQYHHTFIPYALPKVELSYIQTVKASKREASISRLPIWGCAQCFRKRKKQKWWQMVWGEWPQSLSYFHCTDVVHALTFQSIRLSDLPNERLPQKPPLPHVK
jgi:hypothetical protein